MLWAPGGKPLTAQELAEHVGVSRSKIYALLDGSRPTADPEVAKSICECLAVHQGALFFEPLPTPMGVGTPQEDTNGHQRTVDEAPARRPQDVGQDTRPRQPHRRSA
jgi:DNA-binding XRE family transcriptional regulator